MMVAAVDRLLADVPQGVVHPAHVPFEAEAEPARVGRVRDAGPGGRFLGDRHDAGRCAVDGLVHAAQEVDRLQVLVAAVAVRDPLARPGASSRGRASRRPHRRAVRRDGSARARTGRWRRGTPRPPGGRNCRCRCPSPDGSPGAGRRARRDACRRNSPRPCASLREMARHPVEDQRRCPACVRSFDEEQRNPRASRTGSSARTARPAGSPRSRRTGYSVIGRSSMWVKPMSLT